MSNKGEMRFSELERKEHIPEQIYVNFPSNFASLLITAPNETVDLPENPSTKSNLGGISAQLKNNGNWSSNPLTPDRLQWRKSDTRPTIQKVMWKGKEYSFEEMKASRTELLEEAFISVLGSKERVETMRDAAASTFEKDSFLYRAVTESEMQTLLNKGYKYVSHADPSANFETQKMFDATDSQVKQFASNTEEGYSGYVIRWKVQDPLFYRLAGMHPLRAVPLFSHFLPEDLEVSKDRINFQPLSTLRDSA